MLSAGVALAIPRFTAKVEQKCNLCHISPNGGGMRNCFGGQFFAQTEMAAHSVPFEEIEQFNPMLSDNISLGADLRTLYHFSDSDSGRQSTLFQMEGNFYLNAQFNKRVSALLNKGLYSGFEAFGLAYILPLQGYVKIGKFQPGYGWYFDDHTSFVREKMIWPPNSYDTGIEFGIMPHALSASLGFFNGTTSMLDEGKGKAVAARVEYRRHLGNLGLGIGGSYYLNSRVSGDFNMYGPFYYVNAGKFIYTGEVDWLKNKLGTTDSISFATTHELAYQLRQGIWLRAQYDFFDRNTDHKTGSITRYGFGFQYFPIGFVEIAPLFRYYDESYPGDKHNRYFVYDGQIHFFF